SIDSLMLVSGDPIPGNNIKLDFRLKNNGTSTTATNLKFVSSVIDTNVEIVYNPTLYISNIDPGQTAVNFGDLRLKIHDNYQENTDIMIYISIASDDSFFWEDSCVLHVGTVDISDKIPKRFFLQQNYPNPFNPITTFSYDLPYSSNVNLSIYDISGRLIETLINQHQNAGSYTTKWNASEYSSGIYIYRLQAGDFVDTKKMVFMK
ncbi:MAG: T9SS type A sorting domain-containing protein, partial [Candidatus Marinimicrobia bacterium]|nr:T9SS type A sorting domain-containing protein [Candidatus Neomarinimicrobiota bacterium]